MPVFRVCVCVLGGWCFTWVPGIWIQDLMSVPPRQALYNETASSVCFCFQKALMSTPAVLCSCCGLLKDPCLLIPLVWEV